MVREVWVVVEQLNISFQLRNLLQVYMVDPSPIVVCCLFHELFEALLLEITCYQVVGLLIQADVEIPRNEHSSVRIDQILKLVSDLPKATISRSVDVD